MRGNTGVSNLLWLLILLCSLNGVSLDGMHNTHFFQFRDTTLALFNDARRLLASGDIRTLFRPLETVTEFVNLKLAFELLGPAANMNQLRWSRELEAVAFDYVKQPASERIVNPLATISYKRCVGFMWKGSILALFQDADELLPYSKLRESFVGTFNVVETILTLLWFLIKAPKSLPLKEDMGYGPAAALFADRSELGCFTEMFYSVCFMRKLPYSPTMFKSGVACTKCKVHCEFYQEDDGTIVEGELCVLPLESGSSLEFIKSENNSTGSLASFKNGSPVALPIFSLSVLIMISIYSSLFPM